MSMQVKPKRKINVNTIKSMKGREKIVMVTAYDAPLCKNL